MPCGPYLTQVPVGQRVVVIVLVFINVLSLLVLPSFVLQSDGAGLVEARLDVLLAVGNRLVLFDVALEDGSEKGEYRMGTKGEIKR